MSSFGGLMKEYRFVSIDRFTDFGADKNLASSVFFLSHCHQDHMEGLDSQDFRKRLKSRNSRIHCHRITVHLLLCDPRYSHLGPYLESHEIDHPFHLPVPADYFPKIAGQVETLGEAEYDPDSQEARRTEGRASLTVTLLPANHCPGSVMFLFEGDEGRVLYTGDFRLTRTEISNMPFLHETGGQPKDIDSLYFDSTFCTQECNRFPSRKRSGDDLVKLAAKLIPDLLTSRSSETTGINVEGKVEDCEEKIFRSRLLLLLPSKYGHEYLIIALAKAFKCRIHVTEEKFRVYQGIAEMKECITTDQHSTSLHACLFWDRERDERQEDVILLSEGEKKKRRRGLGHIPSCPLAQTSDESVHLVKPSMLWFANQPDLKEPVYYQESARLHRLLYSTHSSLHEIRQIIQYLKPSIALPNVVPYNSTKSKVLQLFADILPSLSSNEQCKLSALPETIDLCTPPEDTDPRTDSTNLIPFEDDLHPAKRSTETDTSAFPGSSVEPQELFLLNSQEISRDRRGNITPSKKFDGFNSKSEEKSPEGKTVSPSHSIHSTPRKEFEAEMRDIVFGNQSSPVRSPKPSSLHEKSTTGDSRFEGTIAISSCYEYVDLTDSS